ncbi:hypothetical protein DFY83_07200 [Escherichia coli]|nr:hypothetical protein [Escherichia coli]
MNIYIFMNLKIRRNSEMWKRRGTSHFFGLLQMRIKKPGFPGFRVMIKAKLPDALRLSGLHFLAICALLCRPDKAFTPHPA